MDIPGPDRIYTHSVYDTAANVSPVKRDESKCCGPGCSCLKKTSDLIISAASKFFYKLGWSIGKYPIVTLVLCGLLVAAFIPGIPLFFYEEKAGEKLWVPENSQAIGDKAWVDKNFPSTMRFAEIIVENANVLTPETLNAILDIHENITGATDPTWDSLCMKTGPNCLSNSLLEFWSFDRSTVESLSQDDILSVVNTIKESPMFKAPVFIETYLGGIEKDGSGKIVSARATTMTYVIKANGTIPREENTEAIAFEGHLTSIATEKHQDIDQITYYTMSTTSEEVGGSISKDIFLLVGGYLVIFTFVAVVLGRFNCIQHRIYVTLAGITCVGLAFAASFGLCSYIGMFYGPVHSILPFLLIGIGVDDMFVIIQSLEQVAEEDPEREKPIHERIALTMQHAGVSITVTSFTDIVAFGIGATTVLPALKSFCVYASLGILFTFVLQATFFVACVALDERRVQAMRNACCCCYVHPVEWRPNRCSQVLILQKIFDNVYGPALMKLPVKITVLVVTVILFGFGIWGLTSLRQESDFTWFLPPDGDAFKYFETKSKFFPDDGRFTASVYLGNFTYHNESSRLDNLHEAILNDPYVDKITVTNWWFSFSEWLQSSGNPSIGLRLDSEGNPRSEADMIALMTAFMDDPPQAGIRFASDVKFDEEKQHIVGSRIRLVHIEMVSSRDRVAAMDSLRGVCERVGFDSNCFAYSRHYINFEGDKAIQRELFRNMGLAFLCVFVMVLLLLADFLACLFVSLAVLLALVDVGGIIYFWGLTIDTVTTIQLIIAVGLIVDYAAHVGHTFLVKKGTRNERAARTLGYIGPAVLFGGFSTFLAFVLLAGSKSYVFKTFFKVLLSVVIFGLFHGLVFLPVLLSWVGPAPYFTDNYEPSILDKGIARLKRCTCTPGAKTKERIVKLKQKSKETWENIRARTMPTKMPHREIRRHHHGNLNPIERRPRQLRLPRGSTLAPPRQYAYRTAAFIPPTAPRPVYHQDPVMYLPMSDVLGLNYRTAHGQPQQYGPQASVISMPNMGWDPTFQRFPTRIEQPTAWIPSYRTRGGFHPPT